MSDKSMDLPSPPSQLTSGHRGSQDLESLHDNAFTFGDIVSCLMFFVFIY